MLSDDIELCVVAIIALIPYVRSHYSFSPVGSMPGDALIIRIETISLR